LLYLTSPGPGVGWENEERMSIIERDPTDIMLALAVFHHLTISNNLPFATLVGFLAKIYRWLIIKFIPKIESQVQRLLQATRDIVSTCI
jgi:hypothetical protein